MLPNQTPLHWLVTCNISGRRNNCSKCRSNCTRPKPKETSTPYSDYNLGYKAIESLQSFTLARILKALQLHSFCRYHSGDSNDLLTSVRMQASAQASTQRNYYLFCAGKMLKLSCSKPKGMEMLLFCSCVDFGRLCNYPKGHNSWRLFFFI